MYPFTRAAISAVALWFGAPSWGQEALPYDTASDEPTRAEANLFHPPTRLSAADGVIDSGPSWGHSGPWIEDVGRYGARDLVVGDFSGLFRLYRNEGTDRVPRYAAAVNLQAGGADAKVPIY